MNRAPTPLDSRAVLKIDGDAGETLARAADALLGGGAPQRTLC